MANYYIQQSININIIRINGITNSSVLQIGSAGIIKPASYLYNTGGFTEPAPEAVLPTEVAMEPEAPPFAPVVPLTTPVA
ncbi:spore germination protein GerPB [Bacillus sp. B15-48]|uniref:spore germination protein GerPB n=1 Tax=Bacillus sp. B15-48 TaxID=1548601 RepID=UPI00193FED92|nr:spore germination protein GerPB [Bacillus sp. B15-48]MBM4764200.1 spore gernimation protein [Bacillus sp. B15-48]